MFNGFIQFKNQITSYIIHHRETKINNLLSHKNTNDYLVNGSNIAYVPNKRK